MVSLFPRSSGIEDILSGSEDEDNSHLRSSQQATATSLRGKKSEAAGSLTSAPVDYRDSLDLSGRELTHTRGLAQTFVAVMTLNLSKNSISMIGALPIGLRVLDISCNILLDLQGCSALKRLEKIDVSHNRIQSFAGIEGCSSLKHMYAQSNPLQIVTHIDLCPHLQLLDMSDCSISSWDGLRVLSLCKSLRQLAMKGCPVSSRPASRARVVHLVPHLTILDGVPMPNSTANPRPPSPRPASPRGPPTPKQPSKGREPDAVNASAVDSSRVYSASISTNVGSVKPVSARMSGGLSAKSASKGSSEGVRSKWSMEDEEEMRLRAQEQAHRWQERLDRHRVQQELNQSQNEVRIFGAAALAKANKSPESSPPRRPLSPGKQALKAKMLSQGLSVVDVNFIDSSSAQLRDSQSRDTPTRVRHASVLSPFDGSSSISRGAITLDQVSQPNYVTDKALNRSGAASGALKSRSPVKVSVPSTQSSNTQDGSEILVLRQQIAALRKDVIVLQASMMVLTKRVGDSPESQIPSLEAAVRRIQIAVDSGEWASFCAKCSLENPKTVPEKTAVPTRSAVHVARETSPQQPRVSKEIKSGGGLGAGMAAAAELEESAARAVHARSMPNSTFSPKSGDQSPKSVGCFGLAVLRKCKQFVRETSLVQAGISLNTVAEQLAEELDTVLIALRKAVELAEQSKDVIAAKYPDLRAIISQCHVLEEVPVATDGDGDETAKDLQRQCSECKAALKKVMNLLERHPGSERLHEQVAKIRAKWMGK